MTIGIYSITHIGSGKRYVGKSVNIERRIIAHKCSLTSHDYNPKSVNRHLYNAVQKYGWVEFKTEILESFLFADEENIAVRELFWIDFYGTVDRSKGFNLRRDSSTSMIVHPETRLLMSQRVGDKNPNFGNKWTTAMKEKMSDIAKERHSSGKFYGDKWKKKHTERVREFWKNNPEAVRRMADKLSVRKQRYKFIQLALNDEVVKVWNTVNEIVAENPSFKWQNIYSVCNGYKPTYMGFKWRKFIP